MVNRLPQPLRVWHEPDPPTPNTGVTPRWTRPCSARPGVVGVRSGAACSLSQPRLWRIKSSVAAPVRRRRSDRGGDYKRPRCTTGNVARAAGLRFGMIKAGLPKRPPQGRSCLGHSTASSKYLYSYALSWRTRQGLGSCIKMIHDSSLARTDRRVLTSIACRGRGEGIGYRAKPDTVRPSPLERDRQSGHKFNLAATRPTGHIRQPSNHPL